MKSYVKYFAMLMLVVGVATTANAGKGKKKGGDEGLSGSVVKVDGKTLVVKTAAGETQVATDDSTVVVINGAPSKLTDLTADQQVTVTPASGTAQRVEVGATEAPKKKKKAK